MAAPSARIDKGTFTRSDAYQETNLLVESVTMTSQRESKRWKDITTGATTIGSEENPTCKWDIAGWVKSVSGFVTQNVGTAVSSLANFASSVGGCDPAVGLMTYSDQKHSWSMNELRKLDFSVTWEPFLA